MCTIYMCVHVYSQYMYHSYTYVLPLAQLRMAVAEALGFMVHLLSPAALNDQLPKLLPGIMQLYKKHSEHYYISQVRYWLCVNDWILPVVIPELSTYM